MLPILLDSEAHVSSSWQQQILMFILGFFLIFSPSLVILLVALDAKFKTE